MLKEANSWCLTIESMGGKKIFGSPVSIWQNLKACSVSVYRTNPPCKLSLQNFDLRFCTSLVRITFMFIRSDDFWLVSLSCNLAEASLCWKCRSRYCAASLYYTMLENRSCFETLIGMPRYRLFSLKGNEWQFGQFTKNVISRSIRKKGGRCHVNLTDSVKLPFIKAEREHVLLIPRSDILPIIPGFDTALKSTTMARPVVDHSSDVPPNPARHQID